MLEMKNQSVLRSIDKVMMVLFFVSFANSLLATLFCVVLLFYISLGVEGEVKILLWITLRGILSSAIAAGIGNSRIKLAVVLGASLLILLNSNHPMDIEKRKYEKVAVFLTLFCVTVAMSSFIESSFPITACFKLISFVLPLCAIMKGVCLTRNSCRWTDFLTIILTPLMIISFLVIPVGRFRIVNNDFQGLFNHVNLFGVICAIYIALVLRSRFFYRKRIRRNIIILCTLVMAYLSASRTGMICCIAIVLGYFLFKERNSGKRAAKILAVGILSLFLISSLNHASDNFIVQKINDFMWKKSTDSILDSRMGIITEAMDRFNEHKLLGTGFMVPYIEGYRDYGLKFDLVVEPGNLIYMLLADTGIIGISLFLLFGFACFRCGKISKLYLFIGAFLSNMGEMVFFSSNNYSILLYFLLAVYMFDDVGSTDYDQIECNNTCL